MAIELNPAMPNMQSSTSVDNTSKLGGDNAKAKEVLSKAMEVLAGVNLRVTKSDTAGADGAAEKKTNGASNVPALDNPDDIKQIEENLEKLISYLQLDNEERQTKMAKDRIEMQKAGLDQEHKGRMKEIDETIKKMKEAERSALANRIFGWLGAIFSVVAAVALTVVTGGVAAGFAIAGAVIAVSSLILNETGAMDKITEKLAEHLQSEYGMSKSEAQLAASLIINISIAVMSLACSIGGMAAGISAASSAVTTGVDTVSKVTQAMKNVQNAVSIANTAVSAGALAAGGFNTFFQFEAQSAQADVTELEKIIAMLQQRLDESQEELQQILEMIESNLSQIAALLSSATDTSTEIAENIGTMA